MAMWANLIKSNLHRFSLSLCGRYKNPIRGHIQSCNLIGCALKFCCWIWYEVWTIPIGSYVNLCPRVVAILFFWISTKKIYFRKSCPRMVQTSYHIQQQNFKAHPIKLHDWMWPLMGFLYLPHSDKENRWRFDKMATTLGHRLT
jgi:hypothetical protein